jgi:hypothetical protein
MTINTLASGRHTAIKKLQKKLRTSTNPYWIKVYEKALDLALNEKRATTPNFYYRLLDDAKRIIRRDKRGTPTVTSFYIQNENGDFEIDENIETQDPSPETILDIRQRVDWIRQICSHRHKLSIAIFNSMLEGSTVAETAKHLGMSQSMVKKLRAEIQSYAKQILTF